MKTTLAALSILSYSKAQNHKKRKAIITGDQRIRKALKRPFWRRHIYQLSQLKPCRQASIQVLRQRPVIKVNFDPCCRQTSVRESPARIEVIGNMTAHHIGIRVIQREHQPSPWFSNRPQRREEPLVVVHIVEYKMAHDQVEVLLKGRKWL